MSCLIKSINYCPVKSVSFQSIEKSNIKKNLGMTNDRIFAFSRGIDSNKSKLLEKDPKQRKLNNFLTLKNSPALNKYNFFYKNEKLTLTYQEKELVTISPDNEEERLLLTNKLTELESSLSKPIILLKNKDFPFYDTSHSNKIFNSMSFSKS
jgi:MOSC N-terminal beta barrel domain.